MTKQKHLKQRIRARMAQTGERYTTARRHIVGASAGSASDTSPPPPGRLHFPGIHPETTALRILLANAGVQAPHTGEYFSEPMVFGIGGGIGAGVFSFFYEAHDFASFYIAGRHLWQDNRTYLDRAAQWFGVTPTFKETGGAKTATKQLADALALGSPVLAWVASAHLPYRGMPDYWSGGDYHVVTVYCLDETHALIGDLLDEPVEITAAELAASRARIKKQKHRIMTVAPTQQLDLRAAVRAGIRACYEGLARQRIKNFTLDAFKTWAANIHGSRGKQSWAHLFPPGHRLWFALTWVYDCIEHQHTGGGLLRPLYADFFAEAADALHDDALRQLAAHYAELGQSWSDIASAALPDDVPACREAKALMARKEALLLTEGAAATDEIKRIWTRLDELQETARADFPLTATECTHLLSDLQQRIRRVYDLECAAHEALGAYSGA